jgi:peptidoglycan/LPS O-acetylase OafA/YrhL
MSGGRVSHKQVPELDGLRAVAISLVILYHVWRYERPSLPWSIISYAAYSGWSGVDVFFGISGFLITGILLDLKGRPDFWRTFYVRRSLRIFPLYYAVLAALTVAGFAARARGIHISALANVDHIGWNWLYLTDFAIAIHGHEYVPLSIAWSLAIEEQYYLVYPFVVLHLGPKGLRRALLAAVIAAPLLRFGVSFVNEIAVYTLPVCRMDSLAIGGLASLLMRYGSASARSVVSRSVPLVWVFAIGWVVFSHRVLDPLPLGHNVWKIFGYSAMAFATVATIVGLLEGAYPTLAKVLRAGPLTYIGKVSYGLYLYHLIARAMIDAGPLGRLFTGHPTSATLSLARFAAVYALSLAISVASWELFEKRVLTLKDKLAPSGG